jgi:hypothetical protein
LLLPFQGMTSPEWTHCGSLPGWLTTPLGRVGAVVVSVDVLPPPPPPPSVIWVPGLLEPVVADAAPELSVLPVAMLVPDVSVLPVAPEVSVLPVATDVSEVVGVVAVAVSALVDVPVELAWLALVSLAGTAAVVVPLLPQALKVPAKVAANIACINRLRIGSPLLVGDPSPWLQRYQSRSEARIGDQLKLLIPPLTAETALAL